MLTVSVVVEVDGLDSDVRVTSVFVKQDSTTGELINVKVVCAGCVPRAIYPPCVLQRHLLCLVEAPDSSSMC